MAKKLFVLDTSVIIFDHEAIINFADNDIAIPITVLEELDNFKKGNDTKNFAARQFIRFIDDFSQNKSLQDWIPIGKGRGKFTIIMNQHPTPNAIDEFGEDKPDHRILNSAIYLQKKYKKRPVILVTKDINLRIKAKSLNLIAQDYETGKMDTSKIKEETIPTGRKVLDSLNDKLINDFYATENMLAEKIIGEQKLISNQFYILKSGKKSALAFYNQSQNSFERIEKINAMGITARNSEQAFALHALFNPNISLVTVQGVAGTGKTLLSLAAALQQHNKYQSIFLARPIVPLSNKDIGYLPGDVNSKLNPYMEPLWDNLSYIKNQFTWDKKEHKLIEDLQKNEKLVVCPLAYIRGRSLSNIFFIVDEAQNLTPHEVKTIISRAGENTKIVFTGDVYQIDTPYLDTLSNGLSYLMDRAKNHPLYAHIALEKGERSQLANLANELL